MREWWKTMAKATKVKAPKNYELGHIGYRTSMIAAKRETGYDNVTLAYYDDYSDIYTWEANCDDDVILIDVDSDGGIYQ